MVLDIDQFRPEKGGNPDKIRENQKNRFCDVGAVDKVIELDNKWRECRFAVRFYYSFQRLFYIQVSVRLYVSIGQPLVILTCLYLSIVFKLSLITFVKIMDNLDSSSSMFLTIFTFTWSCLGRKQFMLTYIALQLFALGHLEYRFFYVS